MRETILAITFGMALSTSLAGQSFGQDADLAKQLSNPVASLISVPLQFNYDTDVGPNRKGDKLTLNVQPVIPFTLSDDWNVISRTIIPIVSQDEILPTAGHQFGLGDTIQSLFLSPKVIGPSGIIWGAGPVFLLPTGTDDYLTGGKWGAGPTAVVLKQSAGLTVGALANHIWSIAGDSSRADVSTTLLQPFISYTTPQAWTFSLGSEGTYNWETDAWTIPITAGVSKLVVFGTQPVSLGVTGKYYVESPDSGPHGWGARAVVSFLFPTGQ